MAPRHVLPFRSVRIPLVIQMPYAILVKHSVRIVHPAVQRRVMIRRTVFLAVGGIERVRHVEIVPAHILLGLADSGPVLRSDDVQHHIMALVPCYVQRHRVVHLRLRQPYIYGAVKFPVHQDVDRRVIVRLLYGHKQIFPVAVDAHQRIVRSKMIHFDSGGIQHECSHHAGRH